MTETSRFRLRRGILSAGLLGALSPLGAQGLPGSGSTTLIATGSAGSGMDYLARWLAEQFAVRPGGTHPVENMQAAGGALAARTLISRPAGSSLLVAHSGLLCTYPLLNADGLAFHPTEDLIPVGIPTGAPMFVVTGRNVGITDAAQIKSWRGQELRYAAGQMGASGHLGGLLFLEAVHAKPVPVFYTRNGQALLDVAEQRVPFGVFSWPAISAMVEAGRIHVLCVLSDRRVPFAPQLATAMELGIDVSVEGWSGLFARRGTSESTLQAYASAMDESLTGPSVSRFLSFGGLSLRHIRRPQAAAFISKEIDRYAALIKRYNIGKG
jgi:tripartite-type tricarboxylate transporter receptor subunit TctC